MKKGLSIIFLLFIVMAIHGQTYYLATDGSDTSGNGTEGNPFRSLGHLSTLLQGGETVIMKPGNYDSWTEVASPILRNGWVEIKGEGDKEVSIAGIYMGTDGSSAQNKYLSFENIVISQKIEMYNSHYVRFKGCDLKDGIITRTCNDTEIDNCIIETLGSNVGSVENIEKVAVWMRYCKRFTLKNSEITRTSIALTCYGEDVYIGHNHVHDISHDGFRIIGVVHGVIEYNRIHGVDDGVDDNEASWSRHSDGIHFYIKGGACATLVPNYDIVVRGNIIYDISAQDIQFNNYDACPEYYNSKFLFENNIFGPSRGGNAFNAGGRLDTIVFRNNTFMYFPDGRTFVGPARTLVMDNYNFRLDANIESYVYNNIFVTGVETKYTYMDYNIYLRNSQNYAIPRNSFLKPDFTFSNPDDFEGIPASTDNTIHKGTAAGFIFPTSAVDIFETPRDLRFDIGAYEVPGQNPPAPDPIPEKGDKEKTIFEDDFEDANLLLDPMLYGKSDVTQGISWTVQGDYIFKIVTNNDLGGNSLAPPTTIGKYIMLSDQGKDWKQYNVEFEAYNAYQANEAGIMLLVQDANNYYLVDIGRDEGKIHRVINGTSELIYSNASLQLPHKGVKDFQIGVAVLADKITFSVDGSVVAEDTDANALATFEMGGIGIYKNYDQKNYNVTYDDIKVTVTEKGVIVSKPVTHVTISQSELTMDRGDQHTLTHQIFPDEVDDNSVTWKSSNTSVATVDQDGLVVAVNAGNTTISVVTADGNHIATCKVTVNSSLYDLVAIDFGNDTRMTNGWNNITDFTKGTIVDLINENGANTGITATVTDAFNGINANGEEADASLGIPFDASGDSFFGSAVEAVGGHEVTGGITLSNLDVSKKYNFTIFGSRTASDNRETKYTVTGATEEVVTLNPASNKTEVAVVNDMQPASNGTIKVIASTGDNNNNASGYYYFGALKLNFKKGGGNVSDKMVEVTAPNGNEMWQVDKVVKIQWETTNITEVNIEYSVDNGANWIPVASKLSASDKAFDWKVPGNVSENCLIRISDANEPLVSDVSDDVFSIGDKVASPLHIVVLGSSTAAGGGPSSLEKAWVWMYEDYLQQKNTNAKITNLAKGGFTTYDILPTGSTIGSSVGKIVDADRNITKALSLNPDAIIINMPSNDAQNLYPAADQMRNYDLITSLADDANIPVWVCTPQPRNFSTSKDQIQLDVLAQTNSTYGDKAIDFWSGLYKDDGSYDIKDEYNADDIHLNDAGHAVLLERVIGAGVYEYLDTSSGFLKVNTLEVGLDAANASNATVTISSDLEWTAVSSDAWLGVNKSSGSGNAEITLTATSKNSGATERNTTVIISATGKKDIVIDVTQYSSAYTLTVVNGTGSGDFEVGSVTSISANAPDSGKAFKAWTGDVGNIVDVNSASTTITMPDADATITATYKVLVSEVNLSETDVTMNENQTAKLTATVSPADAEDKSVTWSSNNKSVAIVSQAGEITAVAVGEAVITVTTADGSKTASCNVIVSIVNNVFQIERANPVVKVYPNPCKKGNLYVNVKDMDSGSDGQLQVFDIIGKNVYSSILNSENHIIPVRRLKMEKGVYIVRVKYGDTMKLEKVIVW